MEAFNHLEMIYDGNKMQFAWAALFGDQCLCIIFAEHVFLGLKLWQNLPIHFVKSYLVVKIWMYKFTK